MATDFLGPAPLGAWIQGTCQVLRASKNMVFAQGLLSVEGKPIARINCIFKPTGDALSNANMAKEFGLL